MSVGANSNGLRGKVKATRDLYKRRESKSSCPILGCDVCKEPEEEPTTVESRVKASGSVAARAQAWEKCTSTAGYVTIGSVRYGVRFSSSTSQDEATEVVPSRCSEANETEPPENDRCCDVMQMAWPRPRGSSVAPSKIPLPNVEKIQSINKRGKGSEERAAPVYRSTSDVSRAKKTSVGCFAVDSDESSSGDMKATPPAPTARRPLFSKPNFKLGTSSGEGDTSRLIPDSKEDFCGSGNQFQITLDKLQRFRFGGSNEKTNGAHKKKRSSDKTERLRELTDKLLHSRGANSGSFEKKKSPSWNSSSPQTKSSAKQTTGSSLKNLFGSTSSLTGPQSKVNAKRDDSVKNVGTGADLQNEVTSEQCDVAKKCEEYDLVDKPENRKGGTKAAVGTFAQRMAAFRSASFSQVDYDAADGKYTRTPRNNSSESGFRPRIGCLTFPKAKQVDASTSVSPPLDKVTEKAGSTPSVDSAVGSYEGFVLGSSNNLTTISDSHKPPGARSLTYPFTKKISKSDEMPFSSIDGNGLKSLQHCPSLNRELSDVKEEVSVSSETPTIADSFSECSNETVRELHPDQRLCDNVIVEGAEVSPDASSHTEKTVYQCTVREFPVQFPKCLPRTAASQCVQSGNNPSESLDSLEKEINDLIIQQKGNTSPKPEIYVTTWPKESEVRKNNSSKFDRGKTKLTLKCENSYKNSTWNTDEDKSKKDELRESEVCEEARKGGNGGSGEDNSKRWSADTSNDCSSEPISPEESLKTQWIAKAEKLKLTCQSSEEREEDVGTFCRRYQVLGRNDSTSEGDSDHGERPPSTPMRDRERTCSPSSCTPTCELSDGEGMSTRLPGGPRRYSKRPLRGPYGQMLEAEMKKPETTRLLSKKQLNEDLKFLEEYIAPLPKDRSNTPGSNRPSSESRLTCPHPRFNPGRSLDDSQLQNVYGTSTDLRGLSNRKASAGHSQKDGLVACHQRTTSSPSQLEGLSSGSTSVGGKVGPEATQELLAALLKGSSERRFITDDNPLSAAQNSKDTRTHVVVELFDTERSYVESLQIIVKKYLRPLKSPENVGLIDASVVDEIFYQVPAILAHHEILLEELRRRLEQWDVRQKVGDIFMEVFTKSTVIETYTSFINNWKTAKEAIRVTCQQKPAFARFLEAMTREHKGKLALDSLIIMPVQRIPRYELLIQRLLKHTDPNHPDHALLLAAQHKVHELAVKINLTERETLELEQQQQTLRDLGALIEGLVDLTSSERTFVRHDTVTMASGQGTRKERALFLFSDLLVITSIKRRSGTIRKPPTTCPGSVTGSLDANKYKLLMRIPIEDLEVVKTKDEHVKKMIKEIEKLTEDASTLAQINDLTMSLHCPRSSLEDILKEMFANINKQLSERQNADSQLSSLDLMLNTQHGVENISVVFTKPEKRASWEESFNECKQKLALSADRRPTPEFLAPVPIRKTRAGLQFTCAAPTLGLNAFNLRDVWVCNSDGYVGQVCVLSLQPEPTVTSCNGVCNARIVCIASIPAAVRNDSRRVYNKIESGVSISVEDADDLGGNIELVSSSSSEEEDECGNRDISASRRSKSEPLRNESGLEEADNQQPTMWLGTEDGNIHVYLCSDNIRIKKNKVKIQHGSSVQSIIYFDHRVFVSLANGDLTVYMRDHVGGWNTSEPYTVTVGTVATPVTKMQPVDGKLWCGCQNNIKVLNTDSLQVEHSFLASSDTSKPVTGIAVSGMGVWISLQNSATVRLFHSSTYENLCDVNVAPAVTKMLAGCDDIIRQHKAACLRVTTLLACKDLLWIGTSAGVVLTMTIPHVGHSTTKLLTVPNVTGVPHGHTGHVRFLTCVEATSPSHAETVLVRPNGPHRHSIKTKIDLQTTPSNSAKLLVISGGDGYEDFRNSGTSEVAGREDSTNHLLLWHI